MFQVEMMAEQTPDEFICEYEITTYCTEMWVTGF